MEAQELRDKLAGMRGRLVKVDGKPIVGVVIEEDRVNILTIQAEQEKKVEVKK